MATNIIEDIFSVKVESINTAIISSKKRRLGRFLGYKKSFKRILITLSPGQFIPFF